MACVCVAAQVWCRDLEYEAFHGYSVELWGAVAAAQGLEEGADWSFTCYDSQEALLEDLQSPAGNCTMSATGDQQAEGVCLHPSEEFKVLGGIQGLC